MRIADLIKLVENRLARLNVDMATALGRGDHELVSKIDREVAETENTLEVLRNSASSL
jgi:hypothetical protein